MHRAARGSSCDTFHDGGPDLASLGELLDESRQDLNALSTWMAFSNFFNRLDFVRIDEEFAHLFD